MKLSAGLAPPQGCEVESISGFLGSGCLLMLFGLP